MHKCRCAQKIGYSVAQTARRALQCTLDMSVDSSVVNNDLTLEAKDQDQGQQQTDQAGSEVVETRTME